ncbi:MAG TPA: phosphoribosylanthranilate isomerase [Burkholderiaceae bacterium]|nr:phosphoribosylanthranilate isomerase [Burkholderiaceae bacterium]
MRTRIKICGLTREADVAAAIAAGADAVGFVCYPKSPRYVPPLRLRALSRELGVFAAPVLLFVNAGSDLIEGALAMMPNALLQFHGDEHEPACSRYQRPYLRAVPMTDDADLTRAQSEFASAAALLVDAPTDDFGGSGRTFNWSRLPKQRTKRLVLAGGLNADNVGAAIAEVRPYAVDVSSGVEHEPGIKSTTKIKAFVEAVRRADQRA